MPTQMKKDRPQKMRKGLIVVMRPEIEREYERSFPACERQKCHPIKQ